MSTNGIKRRKRISVVCENCRRKKIKCDKGKPCSPCVKLHIEDTCQYMDGAELVNQADQDLWPYVSSAKNPITFSSLGPAYTDKNDFRDSASSLSSSIGNFSSSSSAKTSVPSYTEAAPALSELLMLKDRLEQLESSLRTGGQTPKAPGVSSQTPGMFTQVPSLPRIGEPNWPPKELTFRRDKSTPDTLSRGQSMPSPFDLTGQISNPSTERLSDATDQAFSGVYTGLLNLTGFNIYDDSKETINFYEDYSALLVTELRRMNFGPFSWAGLMKSDPALLLLWNYCEQKNSNKEIMASDKKLKYTFGTRDTEVAFSRRALESDGYEDTAPYKTVIKEKIESRKVAELNRNTLSLGLTYFDGNIDGELQLIDRIRILLPSKKAIWTLLDRFFSALYPFLPFVDEEMFTTEITRIMGPKSYDDSPVEKIDVEKKLDLAQIGILLILLRVSYLSLFSNSRPFDIKQMSSSAMRSHGLNFLILNPINIDAIELAEECLQQFRLFRRLSLPIVQLAFFRGLYQFLAPEEGDGAAGDSHIYHGLVVQMSYSIGLNREPDKFPLECSDQRLNNIMRKIWAAIKIKDLTHGYSYGDPLSTSDVYSDTKCPFYSEEGSNVKDKALEMKVPYVFEMCLLFHNQIEQILRLTLNVKSRVPIVKLVSMMSNLEQEFLSSKGTLASILQIEDYDRLLEKSMLVKNFIALKCFLGLVYFHLYHYYERKASPVSFFYLKKIVMINVQEVMPHYFEILGNGDSAFDLLVNPALISSIHKSNQVCLSLILRVNLAIHRMKHSAEHESLYLMDPIYHKYFRSLCKISSCFTRCSEVSIAAVSKISNRYFYAWRITKYHNYLLGIITKEIFYQETELSASKIVTPFYSQVEMDELIEICESTLSKLGKVTCSNVYCLVNDGDASILESETPDKGKSSEFFNVNQFNNEEIDKVWYNLLSFKHDKNQGSEANSAFRGNAPRDYDYEGVGDFNYFNSIINDL